MKRLLAISGLLAALLFSSTSFAQDEPAFIEGFGDFPLLPGYEEKTGARLVFDTPSGTIAETILVTRLSWNDARKEYGIALEGLGWTHTGTLFEREKSQKESLGWTPIFARDGQTLSLTVVQVREGTEVRIEIAPEKEARTNAIDQNTGN